MADSHEPIDVFVSYAAADRERVRPLVEALERATLNVWWDRRIAPGAGFDAEIQDALDAARCVLVVWSEQSVRSEWVISEANEGLERGVLVPVSIDSARPPLAFRRRQTITIADSAAAKEDVLAAVRSVLAGEHMEIPARRARSGRAIWIGAAAALGMIIGVFLHQATMVPRAMDTANKPIVRAALPLPDWHDWKRMNNPVPSIAISPAGDTIVYVARDTNGVSRLVKRDLGELDAVELSGTEGAYDPFFSPDGTWVGYFAGRNLVRVPIDGGQPSVIAQITQTESWGASWGADDRIVYAEGRMGLKSISALGTDPRTITVLDEARDEGSHRLPHHLRDHPVLLFTVMIERGQFRHEVWALDIETGEQRYLFDGLMPNYVSSGHIVYAKGDGAGRGALWAVPFDPTQMATTGSTRPVQGRTGGRDGSAYAASTAGPLVYLPGQGDIRGTLVLEEPGRETRTLGAGLFESPQFSNDGRYVAATRLDEVPPAIWIYEIRSGASRRVAQPALGPLWDPDDRGMTYMEPGVGLVRQRLDDASSRQTLVSHTRNIFPSAWLEDGERFLYAAVNPTTTGDAYLREADGKSRHIYADGASFPSLSTDERWLALCTWPQGVLIGRFPSFASFAIATESGCVPKWSPDGTQLFYQDFDTLWSVRTDIGSEVAFGERRKVAELGLPGRGLYDVDDHGRIVVARHSFTDPKPPVLLLNWAEHLAQ